MFRVQLSFLNPYWTNEKKPNAQTIGESVIRTNALLTDHDLSLLLEAFVLTMNNE